MRLPNLISVCGLLVSLFASALALAQDPSVPTPPAPTQAPPMVANESPPPPSLPPESPPPATALADAPPQPRRSRTRFAPELSAGYAFQSAFAVPMTGFNASAVLAGEVGKLRLGAVIEATFASSDFGLTTTTTSIGPLLEGRFGRFGVGGGFRVGTFNVAETLSDSTQFTLSAGLHARVTFDVFRFNDSDGGAVFLVAKGSVDTIGTALYGASAGLGVRL